MRGSARGVCSDEQLSQHLTCWTETLADEPLDLLQGLTGPPETSEGREERAIVANQPRRCWR